MIKSDIATIIGILKTAYPQYYKDKNTIIDTTNLWYEMFENDDINLIKIAVKNYITNNTSGFPPTIGEIKNEIYKLTNKDTAPIELWNELKEACRQGLYYSAEIFPKLSKEIQVFLKNPMQLKELSMIDNNTLDTVIRGQFLKQVEVIQKREKEQVLMLPETKTFIDGLIDRIDKNLVIGE